jgi:hypothetical protein
MAEESTFGKIFGDLSLGGLLGTIISGAGYKNQLDRLGSFGQRAQTGAEAIGQQSCCRYKVCSLSLSQALQALVLVLLPEGSTQFNLSPQEQALQNQLFGGAGQFYGQAQAAYCTD